MFALEPAFGLPPTLTPNAVLAMAPPAPRRLSFLGACLVYASCALAMTLAPSLNLGEASKPKTDAGGFVVPEAPREVIVDLTPPPPSVARRQPGILLEGAPTRDDTWVPPTPLNQVPETPTTLPTDHSRDSVQGGVRDPLSTVPVGPGTGLDRGLPGPGSTTVNFDFLQMRVLQQVAPVYPALARAAKIQGEVVLLMAVDPRGIPTEVRALSGPHVSLEQEAMRVARLWRFAPATLNGQPVSAQFRLTILFRLK